MSKEDRMIELLEELVKWTKVTSVPSVKKLLLEILPNPEDKIAYQLSDGKTRREIANQANVSGRTISSWWKKWIRNGIAVPISVQRGKRAKRIFSLDDFGIEIPPLKEAKPEIKETEGKGSKESEKAVKEVES